MVPPPLNHTDTKVPVYGIHLYQITDNSARDFVAAASCCNGYPGPLPVSIERADFDLIRTKKWLVAPKHDGFRCLLCFTRFNGVKVCFMMDRTLQAYLVGLKHVPTQLFQDTIFDCEYCVEGYGKPHMQIFDAIVIAGVNVRCDPFSERLRKVRECLAQYYSIHERDPVVLKAKDFYDQVTDEFDKCKNDGIVLVEDGPPVTVGRTKTTLKWKPPGKHTVDFEIHADGVGLCVYDPKTRKAKKVAAMAPVLKGLYPPHKIVECSVAASGAVDTIIGTRIDKTRSNDLLTYTKTVQNVAENILQDELKQLLAR